MVPVWQVRHVTSTISVLKYALAMLIATTLTCFVMTEPHPLLAKQKTAQVIHNVWGLQPAI